MSSPKPPAFVADPGRVGALAADIRAGRLSPVTLVQRYLDRIAEVEAHVQAWREIDATRALALAATREAEAKAGRIRGPLHGIPVAIKDIIDVEGLPTRCNSRSRIAIAPASNDAEIVLALRTAGAIPLGKVHTTEFAFFDPSPARNPHNIAHTPGGSSSGSAAAVAAGMAPLALGTQTVASVNRPAAYCGVAAFKPSTGSTSIFGVSPLAPSYDTVGFYGWTVDDAALAFEAVASPYLAPRGPEKPALLVIVPEDRHLDDTNAEIRTAMARTAQAFARAGHKVESRVSPIPFDKLFRLQRQTMLYEAGRALHHLQEKPDGVGEKILAAVKEGLTINTPTYLDARGEIDRMRAALFETFADADVFMWPATPEPAPEGLAWTGDPKYIAPWTALGGPIVTLPIGFSRNALPIACILSGRPGSDHDMCSHARRLAAASVGEQAG
jgi:Asp-tRNA(Asn)/Glu-tRNA(Gln) amidotransferase A subunit family amidase